MKIYIAHSSSHDFKTELYEPIKRSSLYGMHELIFPHEGELRNSKNIISTCDLIIAEASYPSIGLGIELGWANDLEKSIFCIHKAGTKFSPGLQLICKKIMSYTSDIELTACINKIIAEKQFS